MIAPKLLRRVDNSIIRGVSESPELPVDMVGYEEWGISIAQFYAKPCFGCLDSLVDCFGCQCQFLGCHFQLLGGHFQFLGVMFNSLEAIFNLLEAIFNSLGAFFNALEAIFDSLGLFSIPCMQFSIPWRPFSIPRVYFQLLGGNFRFLGARYGSMGGKRRVTLGRSAISDLPLGVLIRNQEEPERSLGARGGQGYRARRGRGGRAFLELLKTILLRIPRLMFPRLRILTTHCLMRRSLASSGPLTPFGSSLIPDQTGNTMQRKSFDIISPAHKINRS